MQKIIQKSALFSVKTLGYLSTCALFFAATAQAEDFDAGSLQQQIQREINKNQIEPKNEFNLKPQKVEPLDTLGNEAIEVAGFKVTGISFITNEEAQAALKAYNNQSLTFGQIKEAAAAIAAIYAKMGMVAQAIVPPQDVVNGVIQIKVIEGRVGDVIVDNVTEENKARIKPGVIESFVQKHNAKGEAIDLKGLERSLGLINGLPGVKASGELLQGAKEETTNIKVTVQESSLFGARIDLSNNGSASTGIAQAMASLNLNNLLGIGDLASVDLLASEGSKYAQVRYGIPVGSDGWRVFAAASALEYKTLTSFSNNVSEGDARTIGLYATYAFKLSPTPSHTINASYENKNYSNQPGVNESTSYDINNLSVGVTGNYLMSDTYVSWGMTALIGQLNLKSISLVLQDQYGPKTDGFFTKINFNVGVAKPLPFERTQLQVSAYGQISPDNLNSAEKFYLGGTYGVRAYPVSQGGGSSGAVVSAEVSHVLLNGIQVSGFLDAGVVQQYADAWEGWQGAGNPTKAGNVYELYAVGVAAKYNISRLQLQSTLAYRLGDNPLHNQSGQQLNTDNEYRNVQFWVRAAMAF